MYTFAHMKELGNESIYNLSDFTIKKIQKTKKISLQTTIPENLYNNEDAKRDLHRSNSTWEVEKDLSKLGAWGP